MVAKKKKDETMDLISQSEAAEIRGVSREAIHRLVKRGRLRSVEISGRAFVYRSEVESFEPSKGGRPPNLTSTAKRATGKKNASKNPSGKKKKGGKK
jgi:excisionase family DNA binding protein